MQQTPGALPGAKSGAAPKAEPGIAPDGAGASGGFEDPRARRAVWTWGILEALAGALWSGPTAAFLAAFAVELGAGGIQLGILLALNSLLANGLQLYGSQWTRRGRTGHRVYGAAAVSRGTWFFAGALPAALALVGRYGLALGAFLVLLIVSSVATALANPAMGARAATAVPEAGRTRYLADRMMALWLGVLLGTAGMTALLTLQPGPTGYAVGFAIAAGIGLIGLAAYSALLRASTAMGTPEGAAQARPVFEPEAERLDDEGLRGEAGGVGTGTVGHLHLHPGFPPEAGRPEGVGVSKPVTQPTDGWWPRLARRLGAPASPALGQLVLAAAVLQGGASMIGPAAPIWLVRHLGAPPSYLGMVSLASSLAAIASQRVWARWIERWGADRALGLAAAGAALIPVGWMLVREPWVALAISAYGGVAWGGYTLAMTARLLQMAPAAERPAYLGTYAAAVGASSAAGALIAGIITQAVPIVWIPVVFLLSFLVRGLGWAGLARRSSTLAGGAGVALETGDPDELHDGDDNGHGDRRR